MTDHNNGLSGQDRPARALLDTLFDDSRLYRTSKDYKELLDFVVRLRNFAPINAMLLQVQKPGLRYAASAHDWRERFGRYPKEGARPLLILWPFGPVALVYDVQDTEGAPLPEDVASFVARGPVNEAALHHFVGLLKRRNIDCQRVDSGDRRAGLIRIVQPARNEKEAIEYRMLINRNHDPAVQFTTLTHELGHLMLGHLGDDQKLCVFDRSHLTYAQQELEAESVAYIVCGRNGVESKSQVYLSNFVSADTSTDNLDLYRIMLAAGKVETMLKLTEVTRFDRAPAG